MGKLDTTTISTSPLHLFLSLLLSPRLSFPLLHPLTLTGIVFMWLFFSFLWREKHKQAGQLRSLQKRTCNDIIRVIEFPHQRGNRAITPLTNIDIHTNRTGLRPCLEGSACWSQAARGQKATTKLQWSPALFLVPPVQ